jgi:hypothetical protein
VSRFFNLPFHFFYFFFGSLVDVQGREFACGALWGLSLIPQNASTLAKQQYFVNAFIKIITTEPQNKVLKYACLVLQNLALVEDSRAALVSEYKLHVAFLQVFKSGISGIEVEGALQGIRYLAMESKNHKLMVGCLCDNFSRYEANSTFSTLLLIRGFYFLICRTKSFPSSLGCWR